LRLVQFAIPRILVELEMDLRNIVGFFFNMMQLYVAEPNMDEANVMHHPQVD
jgi:hypothetical protein